jgi:predicted transcriptional regulator
VPRKAKYDIKKEFGAYLKRHRLEVLKETNLLDFSYSSTLDNSKLAKIEKGEVDFRFDTLIELARTYKLPIKEILGFKFQIVD